MNEKIISKKTQEPPYRLHLALDMTLMYCSVLIVANNTLYTCLQSHQDSNARNLTRLKEAPLDSRPLCIGYVVSSLFRFHSQKILVRKRVDDQYHHIIRYRHFHFPPVYRLSSIYLKGLVCFQLVYPVTDYPKRSFPC